MDRIFRASSVTICLCLGLVTPLLAIKTATAAGANPPSSTPQVSQKCLTDLQAFNSQTQKDGYWLGASAYGYGYPMSGFGNGTPESRSTNPNGYQNARPGYDVRMLVVAANILARHGQQQACEDVLSTTRDIYKVYVADMHKRNMPLENAPDWWQQQINAAKPVTGDSVSFRSDELLGADIRTQQDVSLGTITDLVMDPQTGKIAYLVVGRGGLFGIDEKYVPVPWEAFKITPNGMLLVLDTTKGAMTDAPSVRDEQFSTPGQFDQESKKVDAYWKTHLQSADASGTNG